METLKKNRWYYCPLENFMWCNKISCWTIEISIRLRSFGNPYFFHLILFFPLMQAKLCILQKNGRKSKFKAFVAVFIFHTQTIPVWMKYILKGKLSVMSYKTNPIKTNKNVSLKTIIVDNTPTIKWFGVQWCGAGFRWFLLCFHSQHKNRVKPCVELWFNWIAQVKLIWVRVLYEENIADMNLNVYVYVCVCNTFRL